MSGSAEARGFADRFLTRGPGNRATCGQGCRPLHIIPPRMGLMWSAFLAGSQSRWLRERAVKYRFVHKAVSRFMPGEDMAAALAAAKDLRGKGIGSFPTPPTRDLKALL